MSSGGWEGKGHSLDKVNNEKNPQMFWDEDQKIQSPQMAARKTVIFLYGITEKEKYREKKWTRHGGLNGGIWNMNNRKSFLFSFGKFRVVTEKKKNEQNTTVKLNLTTKWK